MNPENNIFNGTNNNNTPPAQGGMSTPHQSPAQPFDTTNSSTTTTGNVFNGMNVNNTPHINNNIPTQSPSNTPTPEPSHPFFGFGGEQNTPTPSSVPQIPTPNPAPTSGVITPTQPLAAPKKSPASPEQTIKKFTILTIILGVSAIVFLFLAVWGLVDAISTRTQLAAANDNINTYSAIVGELEKQTGTTITNIDTLPVYQPTKDYIYITDWDVKLKIPDNLTSISYILNQNAGYHSYICFNAVQAGVQYFPPFADINQNRAGLGCLYRIPISDGDRDSSGISYGQQVKTIGDNNYFYKEPANLYSATEAEKGLESTAIQLIKTMIVDNISEYN